MNANEVTINKLPFSNLFIPEPCDNQETRLRLRNRKSLFNKRRLIADLMFIFGLFGLCLMILLVEIDLFQLDNYRNNHLQSISSIIQLNLFLKWGMTLSTIVLVALVFAYHWMDLHFFCINNSIVDWRVSITVKRVCFVLSECLVCAIHPLPINYKLDTNSNTYAEQIEYDIIFSLPMFARIYLSFRVMLLNSKLVNDACSQSIGFLNKVKINFIFYFKNIMNQYPDKVLAVTTIVVFLMSSWSVRVCENSVIENSNKFNFLNSLWFIAITFLTIG